MTVNKCTDFKDQNKKVKQLPKLFKVNFMLKCFTDTEGDIYFKFNDARKFCGRSIGP